MMIAHYGLGNLSLSAAQAYVAGLYQTILQRSQSPTEGQTYINELTSGTLTEAQVQQSFLNSAEFKGSSSDQAHWAALNAPVSNPVVSPPATTLPAGKTTASVPVTSTSVVSTSTISHDTPSTNPVVLSTTNTTQPVAAQAVIQSNQQTSVVSGNVPTVSSPSSSVTPSVNSPATTTTNATQPVIGSTDLFPSLAYDGFSGTEVVIGGALALLVFFMVMKK